MRIPAPPPPLQVTIRTLLRHKSKRDANVVGAIFVLSFVLGDPIVVAAAAYYLRRRVCMHAELNYLQLVGEQRVAMQTRLTRK